MFLGLLFFYIYGKEQGVFEEERGWKKGVDLEVGSVGEDHEKNEGRRGVFG